MQKGSNVIQTVTPKYQTIPIFEIIYETRIQKIFLSFLKKN